MFNNKDLEKKAVLALDLALACEQSLGREPTLLAILGELARIEIVCII